MLLFFIFVVVGIAMFLLLKFAAKARPLEPVRSEMRTKENDNDKAKKYFKDPSTLSRTKSSRRCSQTIDDGNLLIEKLKQHM
jgi:hypothetical protein